MPYLQHFPKDRVQPRNVLELHSSKALLTRCSLTTGKFLRGTGVLLQGLDVQDAATPASNSASQQQHAVRQTTQCSAGLCNLSAHQLYK